MQRILVGCVVLVAVAVSPALASAAVSGTFTPRDDSVEIKGKNDGPGNLVRLRVKLKGAGHTGAEADPPGAIQPVNANDFDYTPANPIPPGGRFTIFVGTNGRVTGVVVQASNGGALGPEEELKPPNPCRCNDLEISTENVRMELIEDHFQLAFGLNWKLDCKGGAGTTCEGSFEVIGPPGPNRADDIEWRMTQPRKRTVQCKSLGNACRDRTGSKRVRLRIANKRDGRNPIGRIRRALANDPNNGGRPYVFTFRIKRRCGGRALADRVIRVVFNGEGKINRKRSDL